METFSIGIDQDLMFDISIINVRFRILLSGYANYTNKRHHEISYDLLESKWIIYIENSKVIL